MNRRSVIAGLSANMIFSLMNDATKAQTIPVPATVFFPSMDGQTKLVAYLFAPLSRRSGPAAAVVLLHGRGGPYSSLAAGNYNATTLSKRHIMWAAFWVDRGCYALVIDSFGPRGFASGFVAGTHSDRPAEIDEVTVRPLDAYGGLKYLSDRREIDAQRIGLQGWSNGGSATLATMASSTLQSVGRGSSGGFRAALAFYPGCGLEDRFHDGYTAYAPVEVLIGTSDEEVSLQSCKQLVGDSLHSSKTVSMTVYTDATHDFDDPGAKRQSVPANAAATADAMKRAAAFLGQYLHL